MHTCLSFRLPRDLLPPTIPGSLAKLDQFAHRIIDFIVHDLHLRLLPARHTALFVFYVCPLGQTAPSASAASTAVAPSLCQVITGTIASGVVPVHFAPGYRAAVKV